MDNVRGVNVEAASQQLIHKILAMVVGQVLSRVDYPVHVRLHQVRNNVDILVAGRARRFLHVHQADDILVIEELYGTINKSSNYS